jgi:Plasmid pRiA4b ORF-3-like protein/IS66 C-terminal element
MYTIIETAKMTRLDPEAYLVDVVARIADHPANRIDELLPWNWSPSASEVDRMKDMIARLHVTLLDVDSAIWRRIEVPTDFTLKTLHDALQRAMGWFDGHLHHFEISGILMGSLRRTSRI